MALKNKETLKNYFKKGGVINEKHFVDMIDSSMNKIDDGIDISPDYGLKINPSGIFTRLISFFRKKSQKEPDYSINLNYNNVDGISINDKDDKSVLKVKNNNVGINTNNPNFDLDVNGTIAAKSIIGNFSRGTVPADGKWHKILENLDGINAFEVLAHASGSINSGYYSISHIIALSTFGGSRSRNKIKNYKNSNWNGLLSHIFSRTKMIKFRWSGSLHNYNLEVRTGGDWNINPETNEPYKIHYNIKKLID